MHLRQCVWTISVVIGKRNLEIIARPAIRVAFVGCMTLRLQSGSRNYLYAEDVMNLNTCKIVLIEFQEDKTGPRFLDIIHLFITFIALLLIFLILVKLVCPCVAFSLTLTAADTK